MPRRPAVPFRAHLNSAVPEQIEKVREVNGQACLGRRKEPRLCALMAEEAWFSPVVRR